MPTLSKTTTKSRPSAGQRRSSAATGEQTAPKDALTLLKEDHRTVEDLFAQFESARKDERKLLLAQMICEELTVHATVEETAFYPAVREALKLKKDQKQLDEALVEHSTLKWLIARIKAERTASRVLEALTIVLKEYVEHHVKEEEKEMFPRIRESSLDTHALGGTLQELKQKLKSKLKH